MRSAYDRLYQWFQMAAGDESVKALAEIVSDIEPGLLPTWHPLGFIHVKLCDSGSGETFRLHIWTNEYRNSGEQLDKIHDHLFNVSSRVVVGSVVSNKYAFIPSLNGAYRETRVEYEKNCTRLLETGVFGDLLLLESCNFAAPVKYNVNHFELHETIPPSQGLALTVVHTTDPLQYMPKAMLRRDTVLPKPRVAVPCEKSLWRRLLSQLLPL